MSETWSPPERTHAHKVAIKAKAAADAEALRWYRSVRVESVADLWSLELAIRDWRKTRYDHFYLKFSSTEIDLAAWIARGWITLDDLSGLSGARRLRIRAAVGPQKAGLVPPAAAHDTPPRRK